MGTNLVLPDGAGLVVPGLAQLTGGITPGISRSTLEQDNLREYFIPWEAWKVHDAFQTPLPNPSANDDLGLYGGTFGTDVPCIKSRDLKTLTTNLYARAVVALPIEYQAAETVLMRFRAGIETNIADTSCDLDLVAYLSDEEGAKSGSDICATAAIDINSTTFIDADFTITAATLTPGCQLDIRIDVGVVDGAGASPVVAVIGAAWLLCDVKG